MITAYLHKTTFYTVCFDLKLCTSSTSVSLLESTNYFRCPCSNKHQSEDSKGFHRRKSIGVMNFSTSDFSIYLECDHSSKIKIKVKKSLVPTEARPNPLERQNLKLPDINTEPTRASDQSHQNVLSSNGRTSTTCADIQDSNSK